MVAQQKQQQLFSILIKQSTTKLSDYLLSSSWACLIPGLLPFYFAVDFDPT